MNRIFRQFKRGVCWNTAEAVTYQIIVLTHQLCLYAAIGNERFGFAGAIFSLIYLSLTVGLLGLDAIIPPFFLTFTTSKHLFKRYFLSQLFAQIFFLSLLPMALWLIHEPITHIFKYYLGCCPFNQHEWITIGIIVVLEGIKKILRVFAQTAFYNKATTIIEITGLLTYVSILWIAHALGAPLQPSIVFGPFIIQSSISVIALSIVTYHIYKRLPEHSPSSTGPYIINRIIHARCATYTNQLTHSLFTGNFLINFFAFTAGLANAGILKLANTIATFVTVILERAFGFTSAALLAQLKRSRDSIKHKAFTDASRLLFLTIIAASIVILIVARPLITLTSQLPTTPAWLAFYCFLALMLFESALITYERLFIVEGKAIYLTIINTCAAILLYGSIIYAPITTIIEQLITMLAARLCVFAIITSLAHHLWHVSINLRFSPWLILLYTGLALGSCIIAILLTIR
jgi:O-antigen/teichoic acid export membrane protein